MKSKKESKVACDAIICKDVEEKLEAQVWCLAEEGETQRR